MQLSRNPRLVERAILFTILLGTGICEKVGSEQLAKQLLLDIGIVTIDEMSTAKISM